MGDRPGLSKGELEVARILWQLKSATVREVHETFPEDRAMDFTTVQTYLRRLESKGYAKATTRGRAKVYSPRVKARTVIRETVDDLVNRLFGGDSLPLMYHLIEDGNVTTGQLAELRELIDRLEAEKGES